MPADGTENAARNDTTAAEALQQWRAAERLVAVARRGRLAAEAAAQSAADAAEAAVATSVAAKSALESMALAETSAAKTAEAAKRVVLSARTDLADAETDVAMSELGEAEAHEDYQAAEARARTRT